MVSCMSSVRPALHGAVNEWESVRVRVVGCGGRGHTGSNAHRATPMARRSNRPPVQCAGMDQMMEGGGRREETMNTPIGETGTCGLGPLSQWIGGVSLPLPAPLLPLLPLHLCPMGSEFTARPSSADTLSVVVSHPSCDSSSAACSAVLSQRVCCAARRCQQRRPPVAPRIRPPAAAGPTSTFIAAHSSPGYSHMANPTIVAHERR